jgi:superfamily I DNA/RNA helicase
MQSVFNGPPPVIRAFDHVDAEAEAVAAWINERITHDAVQPHEIGIFVRSAAAFDRGGNAVARAGANANILDDHVETKIGHVSIGTMHLAKGLEFRAVAVMACDDEVIPSQERIEAAADESDLEEVYNTERHLLYVACTRARDHLLLSGVAPVSEFLEDMARQRVQRAP